MLSNTTERIIKEKIFAVIRLTDTSSLPLFVERMIRGGITIFEVTLNSTNAIEVIEELSHKFPQCLIGAGTVIGRSAAETAIAAGAKFLVTPVLDGKTIVIARENGVPSFAGALTPTEVHQAQSQGADFIKLFPLVGLGPAYLKAIRGPLPNARYVPTNGVTLDNLAEYFSAGATAVGLGTPLISNKDIEGMLLDEVEARATRARAIITEIFPK